MNVEGLIKDRQKKQLLGKKKLDSTEKTFRNESDDKFFLVNKIREKLVEKYSADDIRSLKKFDAIKNDAWLMIEEEVENNYEDLYLDSHDRAEILENLVYTIFGYGILDNFIHDPSITEIMVNGIEKIFIERNGKIEQATNRRGESLKFNNNDELLYIIEKIVAPINRKVDESNPIVDARLPNGFRVNVVLNNISLDGTVVTIRKFPETPFTLDRLVEFGTLPQNIARFLEYLVKARYNIIVSGGTGSGKTTFLNALGNYINKESRIITIEDAAELKLTSLNNLIRLETRPPNIEGKGEITVRDLVKTALRMRPDRIIVGEVRAGEALDMLQAMNTGHDGSLSTGHANSSFDMLSRLETMVLMAGMELPLLSIRQQIASAVEFIVHLSKMQDGTRKVVQITEIINANKDGYEVQDLFVFKRNDGEPGSLGQLTYTGNTIKRNSKFSFAGIDVLDINSLFK